MFFIKNELLTLCTKQQQNQHQISSMSYNNNNNYDENEKMRSQLKLDGLIVKSNKSKKLHNEMCKIIFDNILVLNNEIISVIRSYFENEPIRLLIDNNFENNHDMIFVIFSGSYINVCISAIKKIYNLT
jgi:hypothetical protein